MTEKISVVMLIILCAGCGVNTTTRVPADPELRYSDYMPASTDRIISRSEYMSRLQVFWLAEQARKHLPETSYVAAMYDFVKGRYDANPDKDNWEATRDEVYERYQMGHHDGYSYNQSFDSGINFAASLVSLFYGEGDLRRTIEGSWNDDADNLLWNDPV